MKKQAIKKCRKGNIVMLNKIIAKYYKNFDTENKQDEVKISI